MKILALILLTSLAYPCSCEEIPPPEGAYEMSNVVFSGQVTDIIEDWNNGFMEISIDVYNTWKGAIDNQVIILTGLDDCGYYFQLNEEYLIYGYYSQMNHIWTDICTRTNLLEYAIEDLDYLDGLNSCETGYTDINGLCFHEGDLSVIQKMIDNSYQSGIDLGCQDWDNYCGSPNPYMDTLDSWFWVTVDSLSYEWTGNANGIVEPLELGIQAWENGRLTTLMCGAYIYCQLSGPIPEEIIELTEIETLRLEYNYLSGFIPENICELGTNHSDYLAFDVTGNLLCPPYPECIDTTDFWYQDTSLCTDIGDLNFDTIINIQDIIILISFILTIESYDYQYLIASDINSDGILNVLDVIILVEAILNA